MKSISMNDKNKTFSEPTIKCLGSPLNQEWDEKYQNLIIEIIDGFAKMAAMNNLMEMVNSDFRKLIEIEKSELLEVLKEKIFKSGILYSRYRSMILAIINPSDHGVSIIDQPVKSN